MNRCVVKDSKVLEFEVQSRSDTYDTVHSMQSCNFFINSDNQPPENNGRRTHLVTQCDNSVKWGGDESTNPKVIFWTKYAAYFFGGLHERIEGKVCWNPLRA